jgi:hypothetical protein
MVDQAVPAMCRSLAAARFRGRLAVGKGANYSRAPSDLPQDAFKRVVGTDATLPLVDVRHVAECVVVRRLGQAVRKPAALLLTLVINANYVEVVIAAVSTSFAAVIYKVTVLRAVTKIILHAFATGG